MRKILFLPLLRMPSGHHQVADALMDSMKKRCRNIAVKKVDLLSYTSKGLERAVSRSYLHWIRLAPKTYDFAYTSMFNGHASHGTSFKWYEFIFLKKMQKLLYEEQPDMIVCTHGYPSHILSLLKSKGKCSVPVVNAYTDFFINNVWGIKGIDLHLLPSAESKDILAKREEVPKEKLLVTGIPVHERFENENPDHKSNRRPQILVSGGNTGLGGILHVAGRLRSLESFDYIVLCGKNKRTYQEIQSWRAAHIHPVPYISSREKMNMLYENADAIITKPGGVTISEAIKKQLPIFVHSALPGQERINMEYLERNGLVFRLSLSRPLDVQVKEVMDNKQRMDTWSDRVRSYISKFELKKTETIAEAVSSLMEDNNLFSLRRGEAHGRAYHSLSASKWRSEKDKRRSTAADQVP